MPPGEVVCLEVGWFKFSLDGLLGLHGFPLPHSTQTLDPLSDYVTDGYDQNRAPQEISAYLWDWQRPTPDPA
jgi:hypothetical protein